MLELECVMFELQFWVSPLVNWINQIIIQHQTKFHILKVELVFALHYVS